MSTQVMTITRDEQGNFSKFSSGNIPGNAIHGENEICFLQEALTFFKQEQDEQKRKDGEFSASHDKSGW